MKSNFNLKKFLCCILLSLVMAFGNILALFNGFSSKNQESQIYAGEHDCYNGCAYINPFFLSSGVIMSGWVHYTYNFDQDGNKVLDSVNRIQTYFPYDGEYYWGYYGQPCASVLSSIDNQVTIVLCGTLFNTLSGTEECVNGIFSIQI